MWPNGAAGRISRNPAIARSRRARPQGRPCFIGLTQRRSVAIFPTTDQTPAAISLRDVPFLDEVTERKEFYRRSLDLFLMMVKEDPINVPAWGHCGLLLYELGRFDESLAYFRKIIDHEPGNTVAWDAQGFIRMEHGDFGPAADAFGKVLELSPKRGDVAVDLALCLYHTGRYERARQTLAEQVGKRMGTKEHYLMGRIAGQTGDNPTRHFERALETYRHPEGPVRQGVFATLAQIRGIINTRAGNTDPAREALIEAGNRASQTDPDRMILSAIDLTFKVRGAFIREVRGLIEGLGQ